MSREGLKEKVRDFFKVLFIKKKSNIEVVELVKKKEIKSHTVVLYGFVSRDKCGKLQLHSRKPIRLKIFGEWSKGIANIPHTYFPDLTWKDDAIEVKVILTNS